MRLLFDLARSLEMLITKFSIFNPKGTSRNTYLKSALQPISTNQTHIYFFMGWWRQNQSQKSISVNDWDDSRHSHETRILMKYDWHFVPVKVDRWSSSELQIIFQWNLNLFIPHDWNTIYFIVSTGCPKKKDENKTHTVQ